MIVIVLHELNCKICNNRKVLEKRTLLQQKNV